MTVYKYYALIEKEKLDQSGDFIVDFPDLENVFTDSDSLLGAVQNAHDVLVGMLRVMEEDGDVIPPASPVNKIKVPEGASLVLVEVDT